MRCLQPKSLSIYLNILLRPIPQKLLDFTMGSGSTGVACMNTGRKFIGIELDNEYFEIANKRINEAKFLMDFSAVGKRTALGSHFFDHSKINHKIKHTLILLLSVIKY